MDTTETYFKMCDCPEIQGRRYKGRELRLIDTHPEYYRDGVLMVKVKQEEYPSQLINFVDGDFFCLNGNILTYCQQCADEFSYHDTTNYIWLPRQDQLQQMVDNKAGREYHFKFNPNNKIMVWKGETSDWICSGDSMEQLWLAFCMAEIYNKSWDGKEWRLIDGNTTT